jgi:hypothetical protein
MSFHIDPDFKAIEKNARHGLTEGRIGVTRPKDDRAFLASSLDDLIPLRRQTRRSGRNTNRNEKSRDKT